MTDDSGKDTAKPGKRPAVKGSEYLTSLVRPPQQADLGRIRDHAEGIISQVHRSDPVTARIAGRNEDGSAPRSAGTPDATGESRQAASNRSGPDGPEAATGGPPSAKVAGNDVSASGRRVASGPRTAYRGAIETETYRRFRVALVAEGRTVEDGINDLIRQFVVAWQASQTGRTGLWAEPPVK